MNTQKLNAMQRLHYYRRALAEYKMHYMRPFLCNVLKHMMIHDGLLTYPCCADYVAEEYFPEFWQEMQLESERGNTAPWLDNEEGNAIRERILISCINQITESEL